MQLQQLDRRIHVGFVAERQSKHSRNVGPALDNMDVAQIDSMVAEQRSDLPDNAGMIRYVDIYVEQRRNNSFAPLGKLTAELTGSAELVRDALSVFLLQQLGETFDLVLPIPHELQHHVPVAEQDIPPYHRVAGSDPRNIPESARGKPSV